MKSLLFFFHPFCSSSKFRSTNFQRNKQNFFSLVLCLFRFIKAILQILLFAQQKPFLFKLKQNFNLSPCCSQKPILDNTFTHIFRQRCHHQHEMNLFIAYHFISFSLRKKIFSCFYENSSMTCRDGRFFSVNKTIIFPIYWSFIPSTIRIYKSLSIIDYWLYLFVSE